MSKKAQAKVETVEETVTNEKTVTKAQQKQLDEMTTISAKIRYLDKENFTRSQIAKIVDRRYQHVRNVLETPLKRTQK